MKRGTYIFSDSESVAEFHSDPFSDTKLLLISPNHQEYQEIEQIFDTLDEWPLMIDDHQPFIQKPATEEPIEKPVTEEPIQKPATEEPLQPTKVRPVARTPLLLIVKNNNPLREKRMKDFITAAFSETKLSDKQLRFGLINIALIDAILKKKTGKRIWKCKTPQSLQRKIRKLVNSTKNLKRKEENIKFVFKKNLKTLRAKMIANQKINKRKMRKQNIDFVFHDLLFSKEKDNKTGENLTKTGANKNFSLKDRLKFYQSEVFLQKFTEELKNLTKSKEEIQKMIKEKVGRSFSSLLKILREMDEDEILHYLKYPKKWKLPWTKSEIIKALKEVEKEISGLSTPLRKS